MSLSHGVPARKPSDHDHTIAHVVLQAGGRGARLRPATDSVPKPLLPAAGTPLIERLFRQLQNAGFHRFTVIVGWLGDVVEEHMRSLVDSRGDIVIDFIREHEPMGNVGALHALCPTREPTLLVFCDLFTEMDFAALVGFHLSSDTDLTLASHTITRQIEYGQLICDGERVRNYLEKPRQTFTVGSGVAVLGACVLQRLKRLTPPVGICDLVAASIEDGLTVVHWPHQSHWLDVNSLEELRAVDAPGPLSHETGNLERARELKLVSVDGEIVRRT
jgi:NDP-mannose synthase